LPSCELASLVAGLRSPAGLPILARGLLFRLELGELGGGGRVDEGSV
jgi:hypothetical protein